MEIFVVIYYLVGNADIHPGLIVILPSVRAPRQENLFRIVLKRLRTRSDLINCVIEIDANGNIKEYELP